MKSSIAILLFIFIGSLTAQSATEDFVGKAWVDLPTSKFPGFSLPLRKWPGPKAYVLRYYEPDFEKYVVTITESKDPSDSSKDIILAALDLRTILKKGEVAEFDCDSKESSGNPAKVIIGIVKQDGKLKKSYVPRAAWKVEPGKLKFEKLNAPSIVCEPKNYAGSDDGS